MSDSRIEKTLTGYCDDFRSCVTIEDYRNLCMCLISAVSYELGFAESLLYVMKTGMKGKKNEIMVQG